MKVKELIKQLSKLDPNAEIEYAAIVRKDTEKDFTNDNTHCTTIPVNEVDEISESGKVILTSYELL